MQYRINTKTKDKISLLGFGCMRFARDNAGNIDMEEARRQFLCAVEGGVNYFDTAYVYPGSEKVTGQILFEEKLRDKIFLATKLPRWSVRTTDDIYSFFAEQKENLRTDHIDYYLLHNFCVFDDWQALKDLGIIEFIEKKKKSGEILRIGFSYHGGFNEFAKILDDYDWDFTQLQVNYFDEFNQAGAKGVAYAAEKGVSVVIMEPLRGGQLANKLPGEVTAMFDGLNAASGKNLTAAEWALKWVWSLPNVLTALSGMNSMEQVRENIISASRFEPLMATELQVFKKIQAAVLKLIKIPCTHCGYCDGCPRNVDIPTCFNCYNDLYALKDEGARVQYDMYLARAGTDASKCSQCGICEKKCPQGIEIRKWLKETKKTFQI